MSQPSPTALETGSLNKLRCIYCKEWDWKTFGLYLHLFIQSVTHPLIHTLFCTLSVGQSVIYHLIYLFITIHENNILWINVCWTLGESVFENVAISQSKHGVFYPFRTRTRPKHETMIFIVSWLKPIVICLMRLLMPSFLTVAHH